MKGAAHVSISSPQPPKYRHYKPKNLGVVRIDGKYHYLGRCNSPESWGLCHRLVAEWLSNGLEPEAPCSPGQSETTISINELVLAYWRFSEGYYVKDGEPTKELSCMREALRPLAKLYGRTPAAEFGPKALKAVRQHMIDADLSRGVINSRMSRIKRMFKWAVAEELVPPSVYHGLQAVAGLRFGRSEARETEPIHPVPDLYVGAVLPFLTPHVATMVKVQRITGMWR